MRWIKWTGVMAAAVLVYACFQPWVIITWKNITVTGVDTAGTNFGKPAYVHFFLSFLFLVFSFLRSVLAKRLNLAVTAINLAWAIRNFFIVGLCRAGECPEKQVSLYLVVVTSLLMMIASFFPDLRLSENDTAGKT